MKESTMILILAGVEALQILVIAYLIWAGLELHDRQREDNEKWSQKLMAIKAPVALSILDRDRPRPKEVHYVDEAREAELSR